MVGLEPITPAQGGGYSLGHRSTCTAEALVAQNVITNGLTEKPRLLEATQYGGKMGALMLGLALPPPLCLSPPGV